MIKEMNGKKWYFCPQGHKTSQVIESESTMVHVPVYCKHCKKVYFPAVFQGQESESDHAQQYKGIIEREMKSG